jgi:hypothetical protein
VEKNSECVSLKHVQNLPIETVSDQGKELCNEVVDKLLLTLKNYTFLSPPNQCTSGGCNQDNYCSVSKNINGYKLTKVGTILSTNGICYKPTSNELPAAVNLRCHMGWMQKPLTLNKHNSRGKIYPLNYIKRCRFAIIR